MWLKGFEQQTTIVERLSSNPIEIIFYVAQLRGELLAAKVKYRDLRSTNCKRIFFEGLRFKIK